MKEEEIRKKYQRENESDARGTNVKAMDKFVQLLNQHKQSNDPRINDITENFEGIGKLAPNFTIFEAKDCFFMHNFKAYQISEDTDMLVAAHEFGHAILSIMNHTVVPKDYNEIITKKQNSMQYLQKTGRILGNIYNIFLEKQRKKNIGQKQKKVLYRI